MKNCMGQKGLGYPRSHLDSWLSRPGWLDLEDAGSGTTGDETISAGL